MSKSNRAYSRDLVDDIADFYDDPYGFVLYVFPWGEGELEKYDGPDVWQKELLQSIASGVKTSDEALRYAVSSGHGIGKGALTAWVILWFMATRPNCRGVVTANTFPQLSGKTWAELALWHRRSLVKDWFVWSATRLYQIDNPSTWFIDALANNPSNSEAFAGLHAEHVLVIFDEASGIENTIYEVTEGAMTTSGALWLTLGNPTKNTGPFRESFGRFAHRWNTRRVDSMNAKMTDKRQLQKWIEDYGEDSDFTRIRIKGEFPRAGSNQFIAGDSVDSARERELDPRLFDQYPKIIGVDVARFGDDRSVIIKRQGPKVFEPAVYRGIDTVDLAGKVMDLAREWGAKMITVDGIGVGSGVVDQLKRFNLPVIDVVVSQQSSDPKTYGNLRAELWGHMKEWIKGEVDLPRNNELADDLIGPEYGYNAKMQVQLEKKADMKKRGLSSPDIADALALTFADHSRVATPRQIQSRAVVTQSNAGWT